MLKFFFQKIKDGFPAQIYQNSSRQILKAIGTNSNLPGRTNIAMFLYVKKAIFFLDGLSTIALLLLCKCQFQHLVHGFYIMKGHAFNKFRIYFIYIFLVLPAHNYLF